MKKAFTKALLVASMLLIIVSSRLLAQDEQIIKGNIIDESKDPLPGVSVIIKGTTKGTVTDFDGNYSINANSGDILIFSYIGYTSQEITVDSKTDIDILMKVNVEQLTEVVVVGYGSVKKSDVTGAVSSVKSKELTAFPVLSAEQALQGRATGVVVQSNNGGEPGAPISIKIRGNTSILASSDPLIVVDGFVGATMPQQNDIQSIEVLKDASATAIYGSRGSNGVIMVTTKKGQSGELSFELNSTYSAQNTANRLDLLNADEFAAFQQSFNPSYVQGSADTDWQDLLYRTGATQNHQFSFSGGRNNINFYASANYFNQKGVIINSDFDRLSFLSNVDAQVSDKLKLGINLYGRRDTKNGVPTQSTGETANGGGDDVISLMFRFMPDLPIQDENGINTTSTVGDNIDNPYAVATEAINETKVDNNRANLYANYDILENLTFKSTFGFSTQNTTLGVFRPSTLVITAGGGTGGFATIDNSRNTTILSENYLTYTKVFERSSLSLLAGYSYQKSTTESFSAGAAGFTSNSFSYRNLAGGSLVYLPSSSFSETEIQSQFTRVNFELHDKYLLTATVRRDGASNFSENEKYAIFPSAAIGWKISNENFLKDNDKISNLKLRVSYGVTGNQAIGAYESLARFNTIFTSINGGIVNAVVPDQAANSNLKWESSYQANFGLDLGLFDDRVSLALNYYNIDTKDLLMNDQSQAEYLGFQTLASVRNVGEINNKGVEVSLSTVNISNKDFRWTTDFNWSTNKNKVVSLVGDTDLLLDASPGYFSVASTHILREGESVGVFWGYDYQGVYQGGSIPEGTATLAAFSDPGDPLFTDVDGSGSIDTDDYKIIGDPTPDFTFGINNSFSYKNFDLNIFIQGTQGGDVFNLTNVQLFNGDGNATKEILNAWTPENTDTDIPRAIGSRGREISSRFVEDGSYVRLKNIGLAYTLPSSMVEKIGCDNVRLSVSAQNLITITNYSGLDPEVSYFGSGGENTGSSNTTNGFDFGNYPTIKSVTFSLNLMF
ncbi:SusC/RagA family TonB-linked outer membrane protein [Chondrinema litorale]|uniref:SusC/RagA family TonB-linked outer membrane protein n=1 Tax=Chondrinema litorale TaxID=2994555 RepID=UPI0025436188|nr:TonB-dependent receptor [Chondrinema litorale]UZR98951.1 TonB-dependent receptor [Chondrinema litorale]